MAGQNPKTRDYKKEYARDHSSPTQRAHNAMRKRARRAMEKKHGKAALKGKDVDHKRPLSKGGTNAPSNLRITTPAKNRGRQNASRTKK